MSGHNDYNRHALITKLACMGCGAWLELSYEAPPRKDNFDPPGLPTGAHMRHHTVGVHPCKKCQEPARRIVEAAEVIAKGGK